MTTKQQVEAVIDLMGAVVYAIQKAGSLPSGDLYARMMTSGMTLGQYDQMIASMKRMNLIKEENHILTYIGEL